MIKAMPTTRQNSGWSSRGWLVHCVVTLSIWLTGWTATHCIAQSYDHYQPLQCTGTIPLELRTSSSQKYAHDLAQLGDSAKGKVGKVRNNFLLQSNFMLDEMLLSGRVIFNDPISEYVSRVKNLILKDQPELQQQIRIYIVKSPVVNAFATNSGVLLVNMGLLAHLRSEAELAFVLCHEIQHYIRKHPINSYVKAEEIKSNARLLNLNSAEDYIAARTRYSRSLELEADDLGYELYLKSGYTLAAADGVFDMLDHADRPFDELPWDDSFFEWEFLRFPASFTKWPVDSIQVIEDEDDTLSTHPNVAKRRAAIGARIAAEPNDNGETFQVGAELFLEARKRSRFEICELLLNQNAFEYAIYNAYLLLQEEPESHYLRKVIAQSVYGLCEYRNTRKFYEVHYDAEDSQGEFQQLLYFMESMDREAFTVFALHEVWKTYLQDLQDQELKAIAEHLLVLLFNDHYDTAGWLATTKPTEMPEIIATIDSQKVAAKLHRDSLVEANGRFDENVDDDNNDDQSNEEAQKQKDRNAYLEWALTDLFANPAFADAWNLQVRAAKEAKNNDDDDFKTITRRERRLKGFRLGIDKIVLVQPLYKNVDRRNKIPVQYLASEASLAEYRATMEEMAQRNDLETVFLENRNLGENDVQRFNDVATMMKWFSNYLDESEQEVDLVNFAQDETKALVERYGTKYFAWNALVTVTDRMEPYQKLGLVTAGIMFFPVLPFVIAKMVKPVKQTLFVTLVFDMEASEIVMEDYHLLKAKDKKAITRAILYDKFNQIKQQPK